jgi:hypothetical protein
MTLRDIVTDPFGQVAGVLGGLWVLFQLPLLEAFGAALWASAAQLFTLVSVGALTLPPHWPPSTATDWLVVLVGGLFALRAAAAVWSNLDREVPFI